MSATQAIPEAVNSHCLLCGDSGWRPVGNNKVTRCECRTGNREKVVSIVDYKSQAAGER
jgi:hypothetical protein